MLQRKAQLTWPKQLVAVEALFLCCVLSWLMSDLRYDEVLSLNLVLSHDSPWAIFRDYRFANNHFLNNFLEWLWLRGLNLNAGSEFLVRLPAVLFGMGTVAVALLSWRRFLGEKVTLLAPSGTFIPIATCWWMYTSAMVRAISAGLISGFSASACSHAEWSQPGAGSYSSLWQ